MTNPTTTYCGGRFTVPPGFDFRLLPLKAKKVAVISIIGSWDYFNRKSTSKYAENFLNGSVFSLSCEESLIQGYYDCERQLIFLHFRDTEQLLTDLILHSKNAEQIHNDWDSERLKHLYYLFLVSHFIVISSYGANLDTRFIALFKLIDRLRIRLRHCIDSMLRTLPLPRYCISSGRVGTPRLLFVFKLPPSIASRNLIKNENALMALENNLVGQIFNVFYESGLLEGNSSESRLFDLMGYRYVRVLYPDIVESFEQPTDDSDSDDLAQQLLESIVNATMPSALENSDVRSSTAPQMHPLYPPPDCPDDRSFSAFIQCHLTNLLDDPVLRNQTESHLHLGLELPTCKAWFIACYKLYTSLMSEPEALSTRTVFRSTVEAEILPPGPSLSKTWQQFFSATGTSNRADSPLQSTFSGPTAVDGVLRRSHQFSTCQMLEQQFSELRCEAALVAAEASYCQDLPLHYSRTFHLAKVVSAYNVVLHLARGSAVIKTLDRLTRRLARLYIAGRVGCTALSGSSAICKQELHRLPDRYPGIMSALHSLQEKCEPAQSIGYYANRIAAINDVDAIENPFGETGLSSTHNSSLQLDHILSGASMDIPSALTGNWRLYWVSSVLHLLESANKSLLKPIETVPSSEGDETQSSNQSTKHLAVIPHRSDLKFLSSCNCGRTQAQRLDPFDYKEANWEFYSALSANCCSKLAFIALAPEFLSSTEQHTFVHSSSVTTSDVNDGENVNQQQVMLIEPPQSIQTTEKDSASSLLSPHESKHVSELESNKDQAVVDPLQEDFLDSDNETCSSGSSARFIWESHPEKEDVVSDDSDTPMITPRELSNNFRQASHLSEGSHNSERDTVIEKKSKKFISKIPVTFYDAMPTLNQPIGFMPLYTSWALHALGKYFSYSHSSGFSYPGFLRGSNFLLPWDVQLSRSTNWHGPDRGTGYRSGKGKGRHRDFDAIKLFIGFEMECSLGHRFFLSGPERAMVGLMQGCDVRRAVSSLLSSDLPLYMSCRCSTKTPPTNRSFRSGETNTGLLTTKSSSVPSDDGIVWAQLMRVYIALPSAPIRIRFQPLIRFSCSETTTSHFHLGPTLDQQFDREYPYKTTHSNAALEQFGSGESLSDGSEVYNKVSVNPILDKTGQEPGYVNLDNGYLWVARLPFAYQDENAMYHRPKNPQVMKDCCLLGGSITLEEL